MDKSKVESIVQLAKQDPAKFEPLYREYYGELMSFVVAKTGDQLLAEELVSNCFFKALKKLHTYESTGKGFLNWLYTIALNEIRMYFRKSKTKPFGFDIDLFKELLISEPNQSKNDLQQFLEGILSKLTDSELQLLELRFTENLSFQSIGEILNLSPDNAKTKTYRLLKQLKKMVQLEKASI